jgi:hypothetical protein
MKKWLALAWVLVALVALASLPAANWMITGRPLVVDCDGLDKGTCEQSIEMFMPRSQGFLPDYIGFSIDVRRPQLDRRFVIPPA